MPPPADKFEPRILGEHNEFIRRSVERHNGPGTEHFRLSGETPPRHPPNHTQPGAQTVFAVQIREKFSTRFERRSRVLLLGERNFSDEYPSTGFGNATHLTQTHENTFAWHDQQDVVADHYARRGVRKGQLMR